MNNDETVKTPEENTSSVNTALEEHPHDIVEESSNADEPKEPKESDALTSDSEDIIESESHDPLAIPKFIFEYLEMFAIAICTVMLVFMFLIRLCDVRGESMEKTLYEGEKLLVSDLFYTPERGDIVIFHQTGDGPLNEPIVKRVIATSGEWIKLDFQYAPQKITVSVYDENKNLIEVLDESDYMYLDTNEPLTTAYFDGMVQVPEGCIFVLGDNRNHSADSRSHLIGFVDERRILGKVLIRVLPFSKIGPV